MTLILNRPFRWGFLWRCLRWVGFGLLIGSGLIACAPSKVLVPVERTALAPELVERLWLSLESSGDRFHSLAGVARIQVSWDGRNHTANQALWAQKPAFFRAETLNPFGFGSPVLLMATDGDELAVMVPGEGRLYRGAASSRNLQRFTKVPLQIRDLVHLLLYQVPIIAFAEQAGSVGVDGDYLLTLHNGSQRRQELHFNAAFELLESAYFFDDELALRVRYQNFVDSFPRSAFMEMPLQRAQASLAFSELQTNVEAKAGLFSLSTPEGYVEQPIP